MATKCSVLIACTDPSICVSHRIEELFVRGCSFSNELHPRFRLDHASKLTRTDEVYTLGCKLQHAMWWLLSDDTYSRLLRGQSALLHSEQAPGQQQWPAQLPLPVPVAALNGQVLVSREGTIKKANEVVLAEMQVLGHLQEKAWPDGFVPFGHTDSCPFRAI